MPFKSSVARKAYNRAWHIAHRAEVKQRNARKVLELTSEPKVIQLECRHHGLTDFCWHPGSHSRRCRKCETAAKRKQRSAKKLRLVEHFGGCCTLCGYAKCLRVLQFHHLNPTDKKFELGRGAVRRTWATVLEEAKKCVLVCANCHGEIEEDLTSPRPKEITDGEQETLYDSDGS